jgi:opacity protein-like surface antigen
MKKLLFGLFLFLGLASLGHAADVTDTNAHAFETVTVGTTTAVGLTSGNFISRAAFGTRGGGTTAVFCTVETQSIRLRYDGTSPTASVGHPFNANDTFTLDGYDNVRSLKMIGSGTSAATVSCTFEKSQEK